jgi:hypothetical protein
VFLVKLNVQGRSQHAEAVCLVYGDKTSTACVFVYKRAARLARCQHVLVGRVSGTLCTMSVCVLQNTASGKCVNVSALNLAVCVQFKSVCVCVVFVCVWCVCGVCVWSVCVWCVWCLCGVCVCVCVYIYLCIY